MEPEFWQQRWQANEIGFHQADVNPHLIRFWGDLQLGHDDNVLVPLCGKSHDMRWLAERGHGVVGVELSAIAVAHFFKEQGLDAQRHELNGGLECWHRHPYTVFCGDFFQLRTIELPPLAGIYDRAALIALPPTTRRAYATELCRLGPLPILLITLEYPQSAMDGPPFAVSEDEVHGLFGDHYHIDCRLTEDALASNPRLQERGGLPWLTQKAFTLRPRAHLTRQT